MCMHVWLHICLPFHYSSYAWIQQGFNSQCVYILDISNTTIRINFEAVFSNVKDLISAIIVITVTTVSYGMWLN